MKGLYILIITFVSIQVIAQDTYENSSVNNTDSTLVKFRAYQPDFIDNALSPMGEYAYTGMRFGMTHGFSGQPEFNANKYLVTPLGEMQALPADKYLGYVAGFVADFYYHYDFIENAGIFGGIEYNYYGMSSKYETKYQGYYAVEKNMVNSIGVPLVFKIGPKKNFNKDQMYVYAGLKYSFNINMTSVQKASWITATTRAKVESEQIQRTNLGLLFGVNYLAFSLQLDYIPSNFLNINYVSPSGYQTALGQPDKLFFISTTINVPVSNNWIGTRSRKLKKFFKKLRKFFGG